MEKEVKTLTVILITIAIDLCKVVTPSQSTLREEMRQNQGTKRYGLAVDQHKVKSLMCKGPVMV